jgi:tRNA 2-thiocytidine biosynthesis protein TtcA
MRTYPGQKLLNSVDATIRNRNLFSPSDKVLIGISGGKDSLALLDCLSRLGFANLHSMHIRIDKSSPLPFADFCKERSQFTVIDTDILNEVTAAKRKNTCYMCSRAKRKAMVSYAVEHGFELLALAHHRNDAIETLLLNLLFQREISTMMPVQELFKGKLRIVRPFYDADEKDIRRYAKTNSLPVSDWQCGFETDNRRAWIKEQVYQWQKANPQVRITENIHFAMQNINPDFLPAKDYRQKT